MSPADVSLIIAAHRLQDLVPGAVASVLDRAAGASVEVVVASDDGTDYAPLLPPDPRLRFTPVGPVRSGAHAARNRALAIATGAFVMILDGDDALEGSPDAIAQALALARQAGAVAVPSIVRDPAGAEVRRMPPAGTAVFGFAAWREAFSSLHLMARRDLVQPFSDFRLIDDVLFDLRALAAAGGEVPVAGSLAYRYQLRPGQATDTPWERFDAEYARALAAIRGDGFGFGAHAAAAARVLRRWRAMNRVVGTRPGLGDYHRAVAAWLDRRGA
ncbi:glycosyltransferase family 2 protein [Roseomonas sp. JC162]|uniref:Glycosyltransferase family 2 protein n=1 Tax=Neoroseomonas marina TaxID=1232220 RepID=A0A848E6X3_9PROT|nr:glycosyltransferase [Neoroseomonas marina]NMJ39866.1 glycosyltransferase family 2 protein [Neoroseomonas marina]